MTEPNSTDPRSRQQEAIADAFQVPMHLIDTRQPAEHCGNETILPVSQLSTECVLRPGHSGSHANHEGARWRLAKLGTPDTPAGQSALDRIRADADHHNECARLSQIPEGGIAHSGMAAGLRIAAGHVQCGDSRVSLRKADVDLANAQASRDRWRDDYAELAGRHKRVLAELEGSQRRTVRIQTLLDDTRDRARRDAIASRESERQLQQQIDDQAREIDRLQASDRRVRNLADQWFVSGPTPVHIQAGKELFAALEPTKEQP